MKNSLLVLVLLIMVVSCAIADEHSQETKEAVAAAEHWLALVDSGKYAESWKETAQMFRDIVPEKEWISKMEAIRKPMGELKSRELSSAEYTTSIPGAPDGYYVIIRFNTSFTHKESALETVTPMLNKDGKWRVSGYYIR
jgi:opacity protein-like surface antigen